jgi:cobalt-precorrin-5B (C1)-methyltransferase
LKKPERTTNANRHLRKGFTTGACATAAARAAWNILSGAWDRAPDSVEILFPDGSRRAIPLRSAEKLDADSAIASVVKDAGDDPDATDGALVEARLARSAKDAAIPEDHVESAGSAELIIRGGKGVGLATKPGLKIPAGKWAVNPAPRKMILDNLVDTGFGAESGVWLLEISIPGGAEVAGKTLNPKLGIVGGVSILGTTGVVEPHSHEAYVETIRILVGKARDEGLGEVVFCTGAATEKEARRSRLDLPDAAFIRIADFIRDAIDAAKNAGIRKTTVACMPGKLFKYALGMEYTHAHAEEMDIAKLETFLTAAGVDGERKKNALDANTVRGALSALSENERAKLLDKLSQTAEARLNEWTAPNTSVKILLANPS